MLSKIAMVLYLEKCSLRKDTWNQDSVKCAFSHHLFEKSGLVDEVHPQPYFADHPEMEYYLKETFKDEAVILAFSAGTNVPVGHCVVFYNTGISSPFVDVQNNNKLLTVEDLKEAASVKIFKVNFQQFTS